MTHFGILLAAEPFDTLDKISQNLSGFLPKGWQPFFSGFLAVVTVLIAIGKLVQPALEMFHGRRRNQIAQDRLNEALKTTSFWDAWFRAHQLVNPPEEVELAKARVRAELQTVLQTLAVPSHREEREKRRATRTLLRRMFLIYKPVGWLGWVLHVAFYLSVVLLIFYLLGVFIDPATNQLSWHYFRAHLNESLAPTLLILIPLLLLHWAARTRSHRLTNRAGNAASSPHA